MHLLWVQLCQPTTPSDTPRSVWTLSQPAAPAAAKPSSVVARSSPARRFGRRPPSAQLKPDARLGSVVVDCIDMPKGGAGAKSTPEETRIELGHGVIHLYRESDTPRAPADPFAPSKSDASGDGTDEGVDGLVVAVLAIPSVLSAADFLLFVEPAADSISQIRILRDAAPHRCMALIKLRSLQALLDFREAFNGKPFAAMLDDEICRVVRVRSIEVSSNEAPTFALPYGGSLTGPSTSHAGVVELPLCPVCLERLDANASGLVTIFCQHTFRWTNSNCPVCRWSQDKLRSGTEAPVPSTCADCTASSSLWMCLICGNVGCGRYQDRHAWSHYVESTHSYAMELETSRIWDYSGDQYVHRLIQSKTDGKLVELPSLPSEAGPSTSSTGADPSDSPAPPSTGGPNAAAALAQEKVEAIGVEYAHLLSAQLDSQRAYYVSKLAALKDESASLDRDRDRLGKRADKALELSRKLQRELEAERSVSRGLLANLDRRKAAESAAETETRRLREELAEAQEQVRDLMFALDASTKLESLGAGGGDISVPEPTPSPSPGAARRKKR